MKDMWMYTIASFLVMMYTCMIAEAQPQPKKFSLRDFFDNKFDLSSYMIDANGFVPAPIITEPAPGGFGAGLVPVFAKKRPPYIDMRKGREIRTPVAPDITGALAFYTANKTWGADTFGSGTLIKSRIRYLVGDAYFDLNLSFFRNVPQSGEKEFKQHKNRASCFTGYKKDRLFEVTGQVQ
jgi:hypothetical protein